MLFKAKKHQARSLDPERPIPPTLDNKRSDHPAPPPPWAAKQSRLPSLWDRRGSANPDHRHGTPSRASPLDGPPLRLTPNSAHPAGQKCFNPAIAKSGSQCCWHRQHAGPIHSILMPLNPMIALEPTKSQAITIQRQRLRVIRTGRRHIRPRPRPGFLA